MAGSIAKARILGLIIDRREVGDVGAFDDMTDEELIRRLRGARASLALAVRVVEDDNRSRVRSGQQGDEANHAPQ